MVKPRSNADFLRFLVPVFSRSINCDSQDAARYSLPSWVSASQAGNHYPNTLTVNTLVTKAVAPRWVGTRARSRSSASRHPQPKQHPSQHPSPRPQTLWYFTACQFLRQWSGCPRWAWRLERIRRMGRLSRQESQSCTALQEIQVSSTAGISAWASSCYKSCSRGKQMEVF